MGFKYSTLLLASKTRLKTNSIFVDLQASDFTIAITFASNYQLTFEFHKRKGKWQRQKVNSIPYG